jgi:hypothetical protein
MAPTISSRVTEDTEPPQEFHDSAMHQDDAEDTTVRKLFEKDPDLAEVTEWTMLIKLATGDNDEDVNIVEIHRNIFRLMQQADPTVCFMATAGRKVTNADAFPSGNDYKMKFRIKETAKQFLVAHPVRSDKTLDEIKRNHPELLEYLKLHNVFVDLSATGSLIEVVLGPWFGVHPDFTSKRHFKNDLIKLINCHTEWTTHKTSLLRKAKERLGFPGTLPTFQLRTRRIRREIDGVDYSAKTSVFICAVEHRDFWEEVLVDGMADGFLLSLGRFYLLKRDDRSSELKTAITWHNQTLNSMKAIIIRGISDSVMDQGVKPPHHDEERPSLREKLHQGGFVTIISSNEPNKWIGIAKNAETCTNYVNKNIRDLCTVAYSDDTSPLAANPERRDRTQSNRSTNDDKSALYSKQSKSWADVAGLETDNASNTHTESNIARRLPRNVQFRSRIKFDIKEVVVDPDKTDDETKITANDGMTVLTQDDLKSFKDEIRAQFKDELSTAISAISTPTAHTSAVSNADFQLAITNQMQAYNREMNATMSSMQSMMMSMKRFVEKAMPDIRDDRTESSHGPDDLDFHRVSKFPIPSNLTKQKSPSPLPDSDIDNDNDSEYLTQPTKRRAARPKGESPAAKRSPSPSYWDPVPGNKGRGDGPGRGGRGTTGSDASRRSDRIQNQTSNSFQPLAMSDAQSYSGSN